MAKDNELGAAHVLIGADLAPLRTALPNAQRMVNTAMQRMANTTAQFGTQLGKSMGRMAGLAGFVGIGGTMALATREAVRQIDAQKGLAAAVGVTFGRFRETSKAVDGYTRKLQKMFAVSKASVTDVTAFLIREGRFQGKALDQALEAAFGFSAISGTPMQAAQAIAAEKFGQEPSFERYGFKLGRGLFPGSRLEEVVARGREGIGIQQQIAQTPLETGRRALVRVNDRLAKAVVSLIVRLGVLDKLFTQDPRGVFDISPAETLFQQGVDDVVHPVVRRAEEAANSRWSRFVAMGAIVAGGAVGAAEKIGAAGENLFARTTGGAAFLIREGRLQGEALDQAVETIVARQQKAAGAAGRVSAQIQDVFGGYRPGTAALNAAGDAADWAMGAGRNSLDWVDAITTPDVGMGFGDVSGARSDYETRAGGLNEEERSSRGGPAPGENTLVNPIVPLLEEIRDNTNPENRGSVQ